MKDCKCTSAKCPRVPIAAGKSPEDQEYSQTARETNFAAWTAA